MSSRVISAIELRDGDILLSDEGSRDHIISVEVFSHPPVVEVTTQQTLDEQFPPLAFSHSDSLNVDRIGD